MNANDLRRERRCEAILAALADGPLMIQSIADAVGMCYERTRDYLLTMSAAGEIHLVRWKPAPTGRQHPQPIFKVGKGKNARKPKRKTSAERQRDMRARIMANDERRDVFLAKNRAAKRVKRFLAVPNSWFGALPGAREVSHA